MGKLSAGPFAPDKPQTQPNALQPRSNGNGPLSRPLPVRADVSRLERITVCTRPFRAQGPRIEPERIGDKLVIHNYGHGGAGWSLSWGSAALVVPMALSGATRQIAVLGCGALGLTAAIALQRAGVQVTIYARELPPDVRSSRATGLWSPDSRVALASATDATFHTQWEQMARISWETLGRSVQSGTSAIDLLPRYMLSDLAPEEDVAQRHREDPIGFLHLEHKLRDLYAEAVDRGPGQHPFPTNYCRQITTLRFNITAHSQQLLSELRGRGGEIRRTDLYSVQDLAAIPEQVIVNCTGYGARALFGDDSVIPIRGQIGWLQPQPELRYSILYRNLSVVTRDDGIVVQLGASSDSMGWNDDNEQPDRAESERAVREFADVQARMRD